MSTTTIPQNTIETRPALLTCAVRGCGWRLRVNDATVITRWRRSRNGQYRKQVTVETPWSLRCPNPEHTGCRTNRVAIDGTYNPDRKCDDRCVNALGATCSCACAGNNHGIGTTHTN